jgi:hypothetical protein
VIEIGYLVFNGCRNLTSIVIPSSTRIDRTSFWNCGCPENEHYK